MRWFLGLAAILVAAPSFAGIASEDPPAALPALDDPAPQILNRTAAKRPSALLLDRERGALHYPSLPPEPALPSAFDLEHPAPAANLLAGGIQGGLMGGLVGGGASFLYLIVHDDRGFHAVGDWPGDDAAFARTVLGWTVGSALGMHLANREDGNLPLTLVSSMVFAAGAVAVSVESDHKGIYLPLAVVQFGMGIAMNHGTRKDRPR